MPVGGGTPRALPGYGVWSRDGRYAFDRGLPPVRSGGLPRVEVEIGDRFGRHAQRVGLFPADDHGAATPTWSADGSRLLFESSGRTPRDLWAVDADGSNLRLLTLPGGPDASAPAWSADGALLAYTSGSFSGGLCGFCSTSVVIAAPDGQTQWIVPGANGNQSDGSPSWSPFGTQLVVSVCCSGELDVVGIDGSGRSALAPGPAGDFASSGVWSPKDAAIAYVGRDGIDLIAPDGSAKRLLVPRAGGQASGAFAWSHDGGLLAYSAADGIHVVPADGSAPPRLVVAARSPGGLSFSPDDSQLVYAVPRRGRTARAGSNLFIVSLQGGQVRALTSGPYDDTAPAWRPGG